MKLMSDTDLFKSKLCSIEKQSDKNCKLFSNMTASTRKNSSIFINKSLRNEVSIEIFDSSVPRHNKHISIKRIDFLDSDFSKLVVSSLFFKVINCKIQSELNELVFNSAGEIPIFISRINEDFPLAVKFQFNTLSPIHRMIVELEENPIYFDVPSHVKIIVNSKECFNGNLLIQNIISVKETVQK